MNQSKRYYLLGQSHQFQCTYCKRKAIVRFEGVYRDCLCHEHWVMHRKGDPWLELVEMVREAENAN